MTESKFKSKQFDCQVWLLSHYPTLPLNVIAWAWGNKKVFQYSNIVLTCSFEDKIFIRRKQLGIHNQVLFFLITLTLCKNLLNMGIFFLTSLYGFGQGIAGLSEWVWKFFFIFCFFLVGGEFGKDWYKLFIKCVVEFTSEAI